LAELSSSLDILKKAHLLELVSKKNAISLLDGHYLTQIPGRGTEFKEARKYSSGESIRMIDWNMTARMGEPYVKVFQEERERNILIALDVSPSMYTGWQEMTKIEYGVELAASLAYSAIHTGDKLSMIFFQDSVLHEIPFRRGKRQLYQALYRMVDFRDTSRNSGKTDIRSAIHSIQKKKGSRFVIFLISDLIDMDIPDDLRYLVSSHDLALFHIYDPLEYHTSPNLKFIFQDPEQLTEKDSGNLDSFRTLQEQKEYLKKIAIRHGLTWKSFSTNFPVHSSLANFFQQKKRIGH
jgi:uncharacterized protein (DUF58 family)